MSVAALALWAMPAAAQEEMYPGQSVQVYPYGGGKVLLYPDNRHTRVVPRLLQPGESNGPIVLHMPKKHRRIAHVRKAQPQLATAEPPAQAFAPPPPVAPPPPPVKKVAVQKPKTPVKTATATQAPAASSDQFQFSFARQPQDYSKQIQSAPPPVSPRAAVGNGLSRRSQIIFAAGAPAPAPNAIDAIHMLGSDLSAALQAGASKIELQAYGGPRNDKSSDAHRLALKRAIAIRNILIEAGVPSTKIDVKALGGADSGPLDRVDVYVRT